MYISRQLRAQKCHYRHKTTETRGKQAQGNAKFLWDDYREARIFNNTTATFQTVATITTAQESVFVDIFCDLEVTSCWFSILVEAMNDRTREFLSACRVTDAYFRLNILFTCGILSLQQNAFSLPPFRWVSCRLLF